jgi:outer membrane receptor for ferrienterochelin and colicins
MKLYRLLVVFVMLTLNTKAQQVSGVIGSDNINLGGVTIAVESLNKSTISDENGKYIFVFPQPGKYKLIYYINGYHVENRVVEIGDLEAKVIHINLKKTSVQMDEIVVTGTMKEVSKSQSPVTVEIFKSDFFKRTPNANVFESMKMVNGIVPVVTCNVCNTGGISINGLDGPYTMVMIDGMPIVSSLSSIYGLMGIPNSMIDRVEIVKGPASTLYGSDAMAGIINIITLKPDKAPKFSFDAFSNTYLESNIDIGASYKLSKNIFGNLGINVFYFDKPWDKNNDLFTDIALQKRYSLFNTWSIKRKSNKQFNFALRWMQENRWGGELNWTPKWEGSDSIYGESIKTNRFEAIGNYDLPFVNNVKLMYSYIHHDQRSFYGNTPYHANQQTAFIQSVWNTKRGKSDWLAGATFRYNRYDDNTPATESFDTINTQNQPEHTLLPGFFVQYEYAWNKRHLLLLGSRADFYSKHGVIPSPRIAYKWNLSADKVLRVSMGTGFRIVNLFTEEHAALTGARVVEVANKLNPEQSYNLNVNYSQFYNTKFGYIEFDINPFYTYFTNRIIADYDTDPDKIIYNNLEGYATSKGVSINFSASFKKPLKVSSGFTWLDVNRVELDSMNNLKTIRQVYAPRWMQTFQVSYTLNKFDLTIDYTGQVYGPIRLPVLPNDFRPEYSAVYSLHNIQFTKSFHNGWVVYTGVKNIFNFFPISPLLRPFDPFDRRINDTNENPNGYTFDAGYNYAPLQGIRAFLGIRYLIK